MNKSLGKDSAKLGSQQPPRTHISSGCLSLDLALGGGWSRGRIHGAYGHRDIGKSTIIGLSAVREAQKLGLNAAWIGVEPGFDPEWARKNGVDPDDVFLVEPDNGEQAFHALYEVVMWDDPKFDLIVFDSIGALLHESEIGGKTGNDGKAKAGGQAGLVTWGVKRIAMPVSKRRQVVILLNQQRVNMGSYMGGVKQPGGEALEHHEESIVHLKVGGEAFKATINGDKVEIGKPIVAVVNRNKGKEGSKHRALFDFYNMETEDNKVGIDMVGDVLTAGKRTGVIGQRGAYYYLPGSEDGLMGKRAVEAHFNENPGKLDEIRETIVAAVAESSVAAAKKQEEENAA